MVSRKRNRFLSPFLKLYRPDWQDNLKALSLEVAMLMWVGEGGVTQKTLVNELFVYYGNGFFV